MMFQENKKKSSWQGTGWLINESTVVTAAHNLYEPKDGSYACEVTVYIGVTNGNKHDRIVEQGRGMAIAIHWGYYAAAEKQNDIAMIKLRKPLKTAVPIP
jgi:V8-like Glu-specific endopeptidase